MTHREAHWQSVYTTKPSDGVSWYAPHLAVSLHWLDLAGLVAGSRVLDVGGGASTLVDDLLARGAWPTVLDLSSAALDLAKQRLGTDADRVDWLATDITTADLPHHAFDFWHDRAVLHFLTDAHDARAYVAQATRALRPGGHVVVGGFASDGPERCSGLAVARRDPADIAALFGPRYTLVHEGRDTHVTPAGVAQRFAWAVLRRDQAD